MINNLTLGEALEILKKQDPTSIIKLGWSKGSGHSYREYYHELGLEPVYNVSIQEMIDELENMIGATRTGWKGGEYEYWEDSMINLSKKGTRGTPISDILLEYMIKDTI